MTNRSSNIPLEWVTTARLANTVLAAEEIPLSLDDDELAEIVKIESTLSFNYAAGDINVDSDNIAVLALSMDPSVGVADSPVNESFIEDLETFYWHKYQIISETDSSVGFGSVRAVDNKQVSFPPGYGILLATNPSLIVALNAGSAPSEDYIVTIYFKRRRAKKEELLRTLLKRR